MTESRSEPFIHLVDLSHDRVLIAWGAFWFTRDGDRARWEIVDDEALPDRVGRRTCIGTAADPFGAATVRVWHADGTLAAHASTADHTWAWVTGLEPDTEYRYEVLVDGEPWAAGERWDWIPAPQGGYDLAPGGRSYDLRFRTWPDPDRETPPVRFAALGDYGVGIRSDSESSRRQRRIAEVLDHVVSEQDVRFVISLGDNIYQGEDGRVDDESGGEDDDWYSSFFAPYRYALARVPFFPAIGNHDTTDTECSDDRAQLEDNFHLRIRFTDEKDRASVEPGLFYRLQYGRDVEFVCLDTSHDDADEGVRRYFQEPEHHDWLTDTFAERGLRWQIPFSHHPVFCAGPSHTNDDEMREMLVPLFDRAGVRLVLAGHEHNFQLGEVDGRTYVVSGAGGKIREDHPKGFADAGTSAWAAQAHLLLVDLDRDEARLTPVSGMLPGGRLQLMTALGPNNELREPPFVVRS